jgi:DNA polymerase III subunit delta
MTAYKTHQVTQLLQAPPGTIYGYLIYGADPGQVSERVSTLAKRLSAMASPPGEIIKIHDEDLAQSPGRLLTEAQTMPMFGGKQVICVRAGQRLGMDQVEEVFSGGPPVAHVIVEGGNLKKDSKLRVFFEKHGGLAAIPCYGAEPADVARFVQKELANAGIDIAPEALRQLQDCLGGDQTLARSEVEKLRLYAGNERRITLEHVEAIIGDAAQLGTDDAIAAAFSGNARELFRQLDRLGSSGTAPQSLLIGLGSYLFRLHQVKAAADSGEAMEMAIRKLRPPLFFKQEDVFKGLCRAWTLARLGAALAMVQDTIQQTRLRSGLETELMMRAFTSIAMEARRLKGGKGR